MEGSISINPTRCYHDPQKQMSICVPQEDNAPLSIIDPAVNPPVNILAPMGIVRAPNLAIGSTFTVLGAGCHVSDDTPPSACVGGENPGFPSDWPQDGVNAKFGGESVTRIPEIQLQSEDGVTLTWTFSLANCDSSTTRMRVAVSFNGKEPLEEFTPDSDGNVTITKTFDSKTWPGRNVTAYLYYSNPEAKETPLPLHFTLYFPYLKAEEENDQLPCHNYSAPTVRGLRMESARPGDPRFGDTVRIITEAVECDETSDDLDIKITVGNRVYSLASGEITRYTDLLNPEKTNLFTVDHTFTTTGDQFIDLVVSNTAPGRTSIIAHDRIKTYVAVPLSSVAIASESNNGFMAGRPVELTATFATDIPEGEISYTWELADPEGRAVPADQITIVEGSNGKSISFIPAMRGTYTARVTMTNPAFPAPFTEPLAFQIYPLSAPQAGISCSNDNPKPGETITCSPILVPNGRDSGSEDDNATCTWRLWHYDPETMLEVEDRVVAEGIPCNETFDFTFPSGELVDVHTSYILTMDVAGGSDAYTVDNINLAINLYPNSSSLPEADFEFFYDREHGGIPGREVRLKGNPYTIDLEDRGNYDYEWEVLDNDGNPLPGAAPLAGIDSGYTFNQSGVYTITFYVRNRETGEIIAHRSKSIGIFEFPRPALNITVNNLSAAYTEGDTLIEFNPIRDGGAMPEDANIVYNYRITHREIGPDGQAREIEDIAGSTQSPYLLQHFPVSRTYRLEVTAVSMGGNGVEIFHVNQTKLIDVYNPNYGLPAAVISEQLEYSYNIGDTVEDITGYTDREEGSTYNWTVTRPDGQKLEFHQKSLPEILFDRSGNYFFKLQVIGPDGRSINYAYRNVEVYPEQVFIPSVAVGGPYSTNAGRDIRFSGNSDNPHVEYTWIITPPEGDVITRPGRNLEGYDFNIIGEWDVKLRVSYTADDGTVVVNEKSHSLSVYPPQYQIPQASITGPFAGYINTGVNFAAADVEADCEYEWDWGDGSRNTVGANPGAHIFADTGTYTVKLTVRRTLPDGTVVSDVVTQKVTIVPPEFRLPAFGVLIPYAEHVGEELNMDLNFLSNPGDWDIHWQYGDGTEGDGQGVRHSYAGPGKYNIVVTLTSRINPSYTIEVPFVTTIVPIDQPVPQSSIVGPFAVNIGANVPFIAASPDENIYNYEWNWGDGTTSVGATPNPPKAFDRTGTYTVSLTVSRKDDSTIKDVTTQKVTIVPQGISLPSFAFIAPYAVEQETPAEIYLDNIPDPQNWTVTYAYGDGSGESVNNAQQRMSHTYSQAGKYQMVATLQSTIDPSVRVEVPFNITVVPHGDPVPNLEINPGMGAAPLNVFASAARSRATANGASIASVSFDWGDGTVESGQMQARGHTYSCMNAQGSCAYTLKTTVTDTNGRSSSISATVVTWRP